MGVTKRLPAPPREGARRSPLEEAREIVEQLAADASARPAKHSVTIRGHATSISLEPAFWDALKRLAAAEGVPIARLIAEIDTARGPLNLSSALRLFVLFALTRKDAPLATAAK
ncbi:MAG: hypothetical protein D6757_08350 [Alphaproteobacteria bacterium]|nr:MAG: hypothetical protein D6757_08350 [Alphaproteobacteria bacterium]